MKKIIAICGLLCVAVLAIAQTVSVPIAPQYDPSADCYRGSTIIKRDVGSLEACVNVAKEDAAKRKASANYSARWSSGFFVEYKPSAPVVVTPPAPPPPPAPPVVTPPVVTPPAASGLTAIDQSIPLPTGYPGVTSPQITRGGPAPYPSGDTAGNFRTVCLFSHMAYADPILFPGQATAGHLHAFFGNSNASGLSTAQSIMTGPSTCRGGTLNRSSYWVPAMIDPQGRPRAPEDALIYYKSGYQGTPNQRITVPPEGLRMIGGNSKSTGAQDNVSYACDTWGPGGIVSASTNDWKPTIPTCTVGQQLVMRIEFPACWDGRNLTSPDGRSHMAFGRYGVGCPASHPVGIPVITLHAKHRITSGNTAGWRLSSDVNGSPAGSSGHADWFSGWDRATITKWVSSCNNLGMDCGTYLLGNGEMLLGADARP